MTTDASGQTKVALPYGTWQFRVANANPGPNTSSTWQNVTITPGATALAVTVAARP